MPKPLFNPVRLNTLFLCLFCLYPHLDLKADRVKVLYEDLESVQVRADIIRQARSELYIGYFIVRDDEASVSGFALLLDAADRGVKVKVMLDALSQSIALPYIMALTSHPNIEIREFNTFSVPRLLSVLKRSHEKFIIADNVLSDGWHYITGGRNVSNKYFGYGERRNFNDLDVYVHGDSAQIAREDYFFRLWESDQLQPIGLGNNTPRRYQDKTCTQNRQARLFCDRQLTARERDIARALKNISDRRMLMQSGAIEGIDWNSTVRWSEIASEVGDVTFLFEDPGRKKSKDGIAEQIFQLIVDDPSIRNLTILSPYVILTRRGYDLISRLRNKGVGITLITNSLDSTDNILAQAGYANNKMWLLGQGLEIYHYIGPDTMHAKAAIINGGESVMIGTYNFDPRSASLNREIGSYFHATNDLTGAVTGSLNEMVEFFRSNSHPIGPDGYPVGFDTQHPNASWYKKILLSILRPIVAIPVIKNNL